MWNIQGMRGQMSSNCLWHACKAFFLGVLIFCAGTAMCVIGFYIDGVLGDEVDTDDVNNKPNGTHTQQQQQQQNSNPLSRLPAHYQTDPSRPQVRFSRLSFIGPVIMGIGGFIIVATCVMTFEARDSAAKVGPSFIKTGSKVTAALPVSIPNIMNATLRSGTASSSSGARVGATPAGPGYKRRPRNKNVEMRSIGIQTGGENDENGGENELLFGGGGKSGSGQRHGQGIFDRKIIIEAFRKFSRTLRASESISSSGEEQIQRYPSAPSLLSSKSGGGGNSTQTGQQQQDEIGNEKGRSPFMAKSRTRMPPAALRHTMSIDCPSSSSPEGAAPSATSSKHVPGTNSRMSGSKAKEHGHGQQKQQQHHERRKKFQRHVSVPIEQEPVSSSSRQSRDYYRHQHQHLTFESPTISELPPPTEQSDDAEVEVIMSTSSSPPPPIIASTKMPTSILRNVNASVHHHHSQDSQMVSESAITERHHYLTRAQSIDVASTSKTNDGSATRDCNKRQLKQFGSVTASAILFEDVKEQKQDSDSEHGSQ